MDSIFGQSILKPESPFKRSKSNESKQAITKPEVDGQGNALGPTPIKTRSSTKTQPSSNIAAGGSLSAPKPPPPPMNFGQGNPPPPPPPAMALGKVSTTAKAPPAPFGDHAAEHLKKIQGGFKLKKVREEDKNDRSSARRQNSSQTSETQQPEQMTQNFLPAELYLSNASWLTYKDKLKTMITEAGGKPTGKEHLDRLMRKHAKHAKKSGNINVVAGDIDADGKLKASGIVSKSEYEAYVAGREQTNDRNNDFKQNIDSYLDTYLKELSQAASKSGSSLKIKMQEWFGIPTLVKRPKEFFAEYMELNGPLVKTGLIVDWLVPEDITEVFIDGLIDYEKNPKKIDPILEKIHTREFNKIKNIEAALNNAKKKHKSNLSSLLGRNN